MGFWSRLKNWALRPLVKSVGERVFSRLLTNTSFLGRPGSWSGNRDEQVRHFRHWTYIAIRAIAEEIAGITPQVGVRRPPDHFDPHQRKALLACGRLVSAKKSLNTLQAHEEIEAVDENHRLVRLLSNPNEPDTAWSFWYRTLMYLELTGSAFWWAVPDGMGLPCELWVIPSHWIYPTANRKPGELVSEYEVRPWGVASGRFIIPADQVIPFQYPNPLYPFDGLSPLSAGSEWIDTAESMDTARYASFKEGAWPGLILALKEDAADPTQPELDRMYQRLDERAKGEGKHRRPLIVGSGMEVAAQTWSPAEMDFIQSFDQMRDATLALHGVPKSRVGLTEEVNRASMEASLANFRRSTIMPKLQFIAGVATEKLARRFDPKLIIHYPDPVPADPAQVNADTETAMKWGIRSVNEERQARGLAPYEHGGDDPMLPTSLTPVPWATGEPVEPPLAMPTGTEPDAMQQMLDERDGRQAEQDEAGKQADAERQGAFEEKVAAQLAAGLLAIQKSVADAREQDIDKRFAAIESLVTKALERPAPPVPVGRIRKIIEGADGVPAAIEERLVYGDAVLANGVHKADPPPSETPPDAEPPEAP